MNLLPKRGVIGGALAALALALILSFKTPSSTGLVTVNSNGGTTLNSNGGTTLNSNGTTSGSGSGTG